jgi:hypothetical protein
MIRTLYGVLFLCYNFYRIGAVYRLYIIAKKVKKGSLNEKRKQN